MSDDIFKDKGKEVKVRRSFNIGVSISKEVDNIAFKKGVTKSEVVEKALEYLFELLEKEEQEKSE